MTSVRHQAHVGRNPGETRRGSGRRRIALAAIGAAVAMASVGAISSAEASTPAVPIYSSAVGPVSHVLATHVPAGTRAFWVESYIAGGGGRFGQRPTCVSFPGGGTVNFDIRSTSQALSITPSANPHCSGTTRNVSTDIAPRTDRNSHWDFQKDLRGRPIWEGNSIR